MAMASRTLPRQLRLHQPLSLPLRRQCSRALSSSSTTTTTTTTPSQQQDDNKPRTIIVTGAAQGIGKALSLHLALHSPTKYNLAINDVPTPSSRAAAEALVTHINAQGGRAALALADVTKREQVDAMVEHAVHELGPLHAMVANAGVAGVGGVLERRKSEEDLKRVFEVNVFGLWNCYASAAQRFLRQGTGGRLVGAASIVAHRPFPHLAPYSASKAAARSLTQSFALALAKHNITANSYAPGIVDTAMWEGIDEGLGRVEGRQKGESLAKYSRELIALGRTSRPEDLVGVVEWLVGEGAAYVTGQTVVVDGGVVVT